MMTFRHYFIMLIIAFALFVIAVVILFTPWSQRALGGATGYENLIEQTHLPSLDCINHDREQCILL